MVVSMTGFGRGEVKRDEKEICVEVRSLNNRFLDISIRLPKNLFTYEEEAKNIVRKYLNRGRVNVSINIKELNGERRLAHSIDFDSANSYWRLLNKLKQELNLPGDVKFEHLLNFLNFFLTEDDESVTEEFWKDIKVALGSALENLKKMRIEEGKELYTDLVKRIKILDKNIRAIEKLSEDRVEKEKAKIKERVASLGNIESVDENRLEMEVVLVANRIDVTEECIRFKSHNKLFMDSLNEKDAIGRKLNFLLQEMTREANTIGAKAYDSEISHIVVDVKEEVEKIREQVQNIE